MSSKSVIVIPARYASTRFPGKPLAVLKGKPMLQHVVEKARAAAPNVPLLVATDDDRIMNFAEKLNVQAVLTDPHCATGSDRALQAIKQTNMQADVILNLQGDAPMVPASAITGVLALLEQNARFDIATPVKQLNWAELDRLIEAKKTEPFSGTTVAVNANGSALWFSKTILPAVRKPDRTQVLSPVFQHLGVYAYRRAALEKFVALPESSYEKLEGLEQLRALQNGLVMGCFALPAETFMHGGIDTEADLKRAEELSW